MLKVIKIFTVFLLVLAIFLSWGYVRAVKNRPEFNPGESEYEKIRNELLEIVNAEEFDSLKFKEFLNTLPPYRLDRWPKEFWYSLTFADPRGGITIYQDTMMAVALGIDRLWEEEDPLFGIEKKATDIISRRAFVWHDFSWQNHYAREYAALAALAHVIGDSRYEDFQKKLHKSLEQIFSSDGSSLEGTAYGFYTVKLLLPYIYLTGDEIVKKYVDNFYKWAQSVSAVDGNLPPFDNSNLLNLKNVSFLFLTPLQKKYTDNISSADYYGINESVFKRDALTVWVRHKESLSGRTYHQHFSSGDIIMKGRRNWWLLAPGYDHTQDLNRPLNHNLASYFDSQSIWFWKLKSFFKKDYSTKVIEAKNGVVKLITFDNITREVAVGPDGMIVSDKTQDKSFDVYWHIAGSLDNSKIDDKNASLVFSQADTNEALLVLLKGFDKIEFKEGSHALKSRAREKHTVVHLVGKEITSEFIIQN